MKKIFTFLALSVYLQGFSATPEQLLAEANEAYTRSEYVYAIELYEQIVQQGLVSADLFYNLGNAYFKNNQIGPAIINFERALRLRPMDEDINHNLALARSRTIDRIEQRPMLFYERWWVASWTMQSVDGWAITSIILIFLTLSLTAVYLFSRTILIKKISFYAGLLMVILTLHSLAFTRMQYRQLTNKSEAVITQPRITVKSSPSPQSQDLFLLHEGSKVNIRSTLGQWYEISLPNGSVGWIREDAFEVI